MIPPGEGYQWVAAYSNQVLLVLCLVLFRTVIGGIEWVLGVLGRLRGPQLSEKAKAMVEMSKSIATSFNVGDDNRSTGVRFEDVQVGSPTPPISCLCWCELCTVGVYCVHPHQCTETQVPHLLWSWRILASAAVHNVPMCC